MPDEFSTGSKFVRLGVSFTRKNETIRKFGRLAVKQFDLQNPNRLLAGTVENLTGAVSTLCTTKAWLHVGFGKAK